MSWSGRRVMVTGADGFIGSHLTERLVHLGADVRAFCLYNSNGSLGWLDKSEADIRDALDVRLGDIRDARFVAESCRGVDTVFHLAALVAIPFSYVAPQSFVDTNILGTMNMLQGVRDAGCQRLVQTSTSEVYGTPDSLPISESHALKGQSPYSASKIGADKLCEAFFASFQTPVVTVRPFNTYGPRQSARAVIPTILSQLLTGRKRVRLGNTTPKRDLTFVSDTVEGILAAGSRPGIDGETVHLGTGCTYSIGEVFDVACRVCEAQATIERDAERIRPELSEVMVLQSDPSRADRLLGWKAEVTLENGLRRTAEWIRSNLGSYSPDRYAI
jgi:NAD dependent epimerase/dehydratase